MKRILCVLGMVALLGLTACAGGDDNVETAGGYGNGNDITIAGNDHGDNIQIIDNEDMCDPPYFCAYPDDFCWFCDFDPDDIDLDGGFGFGGGDWVDPTGNPDARLVALVTQLHEYFEAEFVPMRCDMELTAYNFERYLLIDYIAGVRGVISEAVINVHPHVVVLMEVEDGMDATHIAAQIEAAADPTRWICVHAEAFEVVAHGNYIVFVMSWQDVVSGVVGNIPVILG